MKTKRFYTEKGNRGIEVYSLNGTLIRGIIDPFQFHTTLYIYDQNENYIDKKFLGYYDNIFQAGNEIMKHNKLGNIIE
jgi:hypothetical protein